MAKTKEPRPGYGAEKSRRYRERHPERVRAANLARNNYKREWEAGECSQCGGRISNRRHKLCRPCSDEQKADEFKSKAWYFIEAREEGLTNTQIERRDGLPHNTVAVHLSRAKKRFGIVAPRSPYFKALP